jgi:hypothetical protein
MIRKILTFTGLVLWMATLSGVAAAQSQQAFAASIPFSFVMGNKTMAPGEYRLEVAPGSVLGGDNFNIIRLTSVSGRDYKALVTGIALPHASGKQLQLGFQRYGDRAFLSEITTSSQRIEIPRSKTQVQREIAKQQHEEEIATLFTR